MFALVWFGFLGWSLVDGLRGDEPEVLMAIPLMAVGVFFFGRTLRLRAYTGGDELVVRNPVRTRIIRRADIEDVRTGNPEGGYLTFGKMVMVVLRDGSTIALEATLRTGWTTTGRWELADTRERLLVWARSGR